MDNPTSTPTSVSKGRAQFKRLQLLWERIANNRKAFPIVLAVGFILSILVSRFGLVNEYVQLVFIYIGINIILTVSLNLINGYMGEFSVGHAGFMAVGAYVSALFTTKIIPDNMGAIYFPLVVLAGGVGAGLIGLLVSVPSFKTRGDYLAIVTLAFNMIVKSVIENIEAIGGPRGIPGIDNLTTLPWTFFWTVLT
ncbi:branched-chain amino acid ABC transporter permease, partial [bacterium]|nr:branched-chain amino acid ABC transporter permease [bacterium]